MEEKLTDKTQDTEDVVAFLRGHHVYCTAHDGRLVKAADLIEALQADRQSLSDRIDVLEAEKASIPEGAAFFKALKHGATFKWMELVQAGTSQARLDAQSDLQILLAAVAKKVEEIEAIDRAALHQEGGAAHGSA